MRTVVKGTISVFTFNDGILARAAHDLALRLERFDIVLDGEDVTATLPLQALSVIGPVEGGVVRPDRYDDGKRAEVERAMHTDVLRTARHPTARFVGKATVQGHGYTVAGEFELAGERAPLSFEAHRDGPVYRARFELQPSRWGISPYKALLGAIKVRDVVRVELVLGAG